MDRKLLGNPFWKFWVTSTSTPLFLFETERRKIVSPISSLLSRELHCHYSVIPPGFILQMMNTQIRRIRERDTRFVSTNVVPSRTFHVFKSPRGRTFTLFSIYGENTTSKYYLYIYHKKTSSQVSGTVDLVK